jgi:hypothetical protein
MAYWQDYPPTHVLVAAYLLGAGKRSRRVGKSGGKLDELSHSVTSIGGSARGKLPDMYRS